MQLTLSVLALVIAVASFVLSVVTYARVVLAVQRQSQRYRG